MITIENQQRAAYLAGPNGDTKYLWYAAGSLTLAAGLGVLYVKKREAGVWGVDGRWAQNPKFRCTRNQGNKSRRVPQRKGWYVYAPSRPQAIIAMKRKFNRDKLGFTCARFND